jgi:hypothetical protein
VVGVVMTGGWQTSRSSIPSRLAPTGQTVQTSLDFHVCSVCKWVVNKAPQHCSLPDDEDHGGDAGLR